MIIDDLYKEFSTLQEVEAIALGGSRSISKNDSKSDYDIYIYLSRPLSIKIRKSILDKYCSYIEISNKYWEEEDDGILKDGVDIDIIYRNIDYLDEHLNNLLFNFQAQIGYTTCFWFNLEKSIIIFDRNSRLTTIQNKYNIEYPKELQKNIIKTNLELLTNYQPSYDKQIIKAYKRKDFNSVNHRVTAFLASYFDIILALNKLPHPGEKRLVTYCEENCKILPKDFSKNLNLLFNNMFNDNLLIYLKEIINNIIEVINQEQIL